MKLRCKDGDLAVITWDHPGCLENIGRIVMVKGPARQGAFGDSWWIQPITENLYAFLDADGSLGKESVTWRSRIEHPDRWLLPIKLTPRPGTRSRYSTVKVSAPTVVPVHQVLA